MSNKLLLNRIRCPNGTILTSWSRHDYKTYGDCMVDGGTDYVRRTVTKYEELSQYYKEDDHKHNRKYAHWGTFGREGTDELSYVAIMDLSTDHINNILRDCTPTPILKSIMERELKYRKYDAILIAWTEREVGDNDGSILLGVIYDDDKCRFNDGQMMHTSLLKRDNVVKENSIVHTTNTRYLLGMAADDILNKLEGRD